MTQPNSFESIKEANPVNQAKPEPKKKKSEGIRFLNFDWKRYYYEPKSGNILFANDDDLWDSQSPREFQRYLNTRFRVSTTRSKGSPSQCDKIITRIKEKSLVHVATSLAGHFGPKTIDHAGVRILVKDGPRLITPKEGGYPTLLALLLGMFEGEQFNHILWWLTLAVHSLYAGYCDLSTAIVLCGPPSSGKSLFQLLLTQILGGRSQRAFQVMNGQTVFNSHLHAAEHLYVEDERSDTSLRARLALGAAIKGMIANQEKQAHGKYQIPFMLPFLFQRFSISLNDESESAEFLPPSDRSLNGKVNLYAIGLAEMPMPTHTAELRAAFWHTLISELPALIYDLLHATQIPVEWQCSRFGLKAYRHATTLAILEEHQPEIKLLELIDTFYWSDSKDSDSPIQTRSGSSSKSITKSATEIEADLRQQYSPVKAMADDLLRNQSCTGRYLRRLATKTPRVTYKKSGSRKSYTIQPPENDLETAPPVPK